MDGVKLVLRELHEGESDLVEQLRKVASRHATDPEVRHGATDLARWSQDHIRRIAESGARFGVDLDAGADGDSDGDSDGGSGGGSGFMENLREKTAKALGRRPEPALLLLRDLRDVHLAATRNLLDWEVLAQAAAALRTAG